MWWGGWVGPIGVARDFVYIVRSAALGDHHPVTSIEIIQLRLSSPVSNVYQNGTSRIQYRIQYRIPERNSEINGIQYRQYCQHRQRYSPERRTVIQNSQRISQRIRSSIYALVVLYGYSPPRFPILSRVVLPHHNTTGISLCVIMWFLIGNPNTLKKVGSQGNPTLY